MDASRCPQCGMPAEPGTHYAQINCRHCNYSGQPLDPSAYFYDKAKAQREEADVFKEELGIASLSSKMALVSLSIFVVSVGIAGMQSFAVVSLAGFLMFSVFYAFLRVMDRG